MEEYKIYFNFDHQNHIAQIVRAESEEIALYDIPKEGVYEFRDNRNKLIRIYMNKVTHIEVSKNQKSQSVSW